MTNLLLRFVLLAPLYFLVVWCGFGFWTWIQRERLWRGMRRR